VAELGLDNVQLTGPVPPARVPDLYAGADLLLLPSYSEPWGAVVNEALAAGVPVMVSDRAGAASLVEHGRNGFIISPDDPAAAEGLLRPYAADASRRAEMRAAARESGARLTHRGAARLFAEALREAA
jgi:glycosyltransferase involved in cell wall biosynthesis